MTYQHLRLYSHYKIQHKHFATQNDLSTFKDSIHTTKYDINISQLRMTYQHLRLYSHYKIRHKHFTTQNGFIQHLRLYSHYKIQHKHFTTQNDLSTFKTLFTLQNTT